MPKDLIHIAHRIKKIRTSMKITQEELAERSYTSLSLIRQVEQGSKLPSLGTLIEIANSLGVTVDDILVDVIDKPKPRDQLEYVELISSCNGDEKQILLRTLKFLKALLSEFGI